MMRENSKARGRYGTIKVKDHPFDEVVRKARAVIAQGSVNVHQKFTCSGCGIRLTIDEPNTFHEFGTCDQCGKVTNIRQRGCNYLIHMGALPPKGNQ